MKRLLTISTLLILISCKERELGNNYYYLPEYEAKEYLTESFIYKSFDEDVFNEIIIYPTVKKIEYNHNYIIALQEGNSKLMLKRITEELNFWNNYYLKNKKDSLVYLTNKKISLTEIHNMLKNDTLNTSVMADSLFHSEFYYKKMFKNKFNYYIIQKRDDSIFGPLNVKEFTILKKQKNIDLNFK